MKRVVINADDLGFAPGVNRGIVECHEAGTLSSASMMVNTPAFHEAAALVRDRAPGLGVGLHLNLLTGRPLTGAASLVDAASGQFVSLSTLSRRVLGGAIRASDLRAECDAQIAALHAEGFRPTHLDSHRHTHALPGVLAPVLASARAAGVRIVRRPLDVPDIRAPMMAAKMLSLHAAWRVAIVGVAVADRALVARAPAFRGIALQGQAGVEGLLLALLDRLGQGDTEIMLHPGHDDAVLAAQDPYRVEREAEVRALTSGAVRARLARGDVRLVNFAQLAEDAPATG